MKLQKYLRGVMRIAPLFLAAGLWAQDKQQELERHLREAQTASESGNYPVAVQELRAALAIHPETSGAYYQLGYALLQLHENTAAEKAFLRELDFPPPDPYSLYYLGILAHDAGHRQTAISYLERSLKAGEVRDVRQKLGNEYMALGQVDHAIESLQDSVHVRPEDGSLHYMLGRAYKLKGRTADAKKEFDAAQRWKAKFQNEMIALSALRQAIKEQKQSEAESKMQELSHSSDSDVLLAAATMLGEAGLHAQATEFLQKVIGISPSLPEAHYDLARAYLATEQRDKARAELQQAIKLKPGFYEGELVLGSLLADEGQADEAIQHLRAAARIRSDNPRLLLMLGLQYYQQSYFADAVETLKKAMSLEPANPEPRYLLIEAYYRNFEYEHALHLAEETSVKFPDAALAHYHLGAQLNNFSRLTEAKNELEEALKRDQSLVEARVMLGEVFFKMGKPDKSLTCFREALAANPKLMNAQAGLGKALIQLKQYPQAATAMEEAIRIDPKVAQLHLYLSQAYRAIGKAEEAKSEAALFSKLNQERAHARDLQADRKYSN